jgi:DNA mismatch endonuclease (patch repair protein)
MKRIRLRNTGPEIALRQELWALGLRYRLTYTPSLPGKPDILFANVKIAVFVDGCFWHGCPIHGHIPKSRRKYWKPKLSRTKHRDKETNAKLASMGWQVLRFWEHQVQDNLAQCARSVAYSAEISRQ